MDSVAAAIKELGERRRSIDEAIQILRSLEAGHAAHPAKAKRRLSPEGRARIVAALRKRWAAQKKLTAQS